MTVPRTAGEAAAPMLDPVVFRALRPFWWPTERLAEGLEELARVAGLHGAKTDQTLTPPPPLAQDLEDWLDWAAGELGLECESVDTPTSEAAAMLRTAGPVLAGWWPAELGQGFLLIVGSRGNAVRLIAPDLRIGACPIETVRSALCWPHEGLVVGEIDRLLQEAGVAQRRQGAARAALLRERLADARLRGLWILRLPSSAGFWRQLVQARIPRRIGLVLGIFAIVYVLEIAGWSLIGKGALEGRLDFGWLVAWGMLILTAVPWKVAGGWFEAQFAMDTSRILKSRLLAGALQMDPEAVTRQGVGHLLGRVMESQALESLALNGGTSVLVSLLELVFAVLILSAGAAPRLHILLLSLFLAASGVLLWRYYRRLHAWSTRRLEMTHGLIEGMVGHRTRLAQERPDRRDAAEDREMQGYLDDAREMDVASVSVLAILPTAWMIAGVAGLAPAFVSATPPSPASLAISLGGLLISQRAFNGISGGLAGLARAAFSWREVSAIFRSGRSDVQSGPFMTRRQLRGDGGASRLLDAHGLGFAYAPTAKPVISGLELTIGRGERILLEGGSGGGKSTLAALLTGLRRPDSGLLLLNGLDRHTLGDNWQRLATAAPQFHENHILSGTLAFNLLMGRTWPAPEADLEEARILCEELGLGELLRRMPAGLQQRVGETGWQLSHGERSRIFLARALLQRAPLTIMDESFAALDPETLDLCLQVTLRRAEALVVIAHP